MTSRKRSEVNSKRFDQERAIKPLASNKTIRREDKNCVEQATVSRALTQKERLLIALQKRQHCSAWQGRLGSAQERSLLDYSSHHTSVELSKLKRHKFNRIFQIPLAIMDCLNVRASSHGPSEYAEAIEAERKYNPLTHFRQL